MSTKKKSYNPTVINMLVHCSQNLKDQTDKLVLADYLQEHELYPQLEQFLRFIATLEPKNFQHQILFTGSRCYGQPNQSSDVDWVICVDNDMRHMLQETCDTVCDAYGDEMRDAEYYHTGLSDIAMRFGPLNLICTSRHYQWRVWKEGTQFLKILAFSSMLGVDRDYAVAQFEKRLREIRSIYVNTYYQINNKYMRREPLHIIRRKNFKFSITPKPV